MNKDKKKEYETKPQYAVFDWIVSLPVIRILKPIYEPRRGFWIYCFLGFVSTVIDFLATNLLILVLPFSATLANFASWIISTFISFYLFRNFYFDKTNNNFWYEFIKFVPTRLFTMFVSEIGIFILVDTYKLDMNLIKIILIPITALLNFLTSKFFVFRKKKD